MTSLGKGIGRAYAARYNGLAGVLVPLLAFEVVSYNLRYVTGSLDGVPLALAIIMHLNRALVLAVIVVRPRTVIERLDLIYASVVIQVLIMSMWVTSPRTTIYLIAVIIGAAVLAVSYCLVSQSLGVAAIAGLAVAVAVFDNAKSLPLAVCESLFVGALFAVCPATVSRFRFGLQNAKQRAEVQAETDELTGLLNRRGVVQRVPVLIDDARQRGDRVIVMVADLDHFKAVNDEHGHATGDRVLRAAAQSLRATTRADSVIGRIGGEEFVLVLSASGEAGPKIAERVRAAVPQATSPTSVTVSLGVVSAPPPDPATDEVDWLLALIDQADDRLYRAKEEGRDRVVAA